MASTITPASVSQGELHSTCIDSMMHVAAKGLNVACFMLQVHGLQLSVPHQ